jgi:hypothetical protein
MTRIESLEVPHRSRVESVLAYQNSDLVNRYVDKLGLSQEQAELLFEDTKKFLYICGTYNGYWSPSKDIDEGWHAFILFTRDYAEFCEKYLGRFIHHEPHRRGHHYDRGAARRTYWAAKATFGELSSNWTYRNKSGDAIDMSTYNPIITKSNGDPCSSCGCASSCNGCTDGCSSCQGS